MLMLSGIQHYRFCPRQWALIYLEQQWEENVLTMEGRILHQHVDDPFYRRKSGNCICLRSVNIASHELGLYGLTDIVELYPAGENEEFISHPDYPGRWRPYPVEYKRGEPKDLDADRFQLCGQAMCLEEMLCCDIPEGALYYGQTRRREIVRFSQEMRGQVRLFIQEMHEYARRGYTPRVKLTKACNACSLKDFCLPKMMKQRSAAAYLASALQEDL